MKRAWYLHEEKISSTQIDHEIYYQKRMKSIQREHMIYMKRSWDLHEDLLEQIMRREHGIYIMLA